MTSDNSPGFYGKDETLATSPECKTEEKAKYKPKRPLEDVWRQVKEELTMHNMRAKKLKLVESAVKL